MVISAAAAAAAAAARSLLLRLHAFVVTMLSQNQWQPSGTHSFVLNQNPIAKHTIHVPADAAFPIIPSPSMQRLHLTPFTRICGGKAAAISVQCDYSFEKFAVNYYSR